MSKITKTIIKVASKTTDIILLPHILAVNIIKKTVKKMVGKRVEDGEEDNNDYFIAPNFYQQYFEIENEKEAENEKIVDLSYTNYKKTKLLEAKNNDINDNRLKQVYLEKYKWRKARKKKPLIEVLKSKKEFKILTKIISDSKTNVTKKSKSKSFIILFCIEGVNYKIDFYPYLTETIYSNHYSIANYESVHQCYMDITYFIEDNEIKIKKCKFLKSHSDILVKQLDNKVRKPDRKALYLLNEKFK